MQYQLLYGNIFPLHCQYMEYSPCCHIGPAKHWDEVRRAYYHTWEERIAALKFFKENLSTNFGLVVVFVKVALEITKRAQHCVLLIDMFSCFFEIALVYLRLAGCRAYKGHLQNEWVIKTFRKPPKGSKFVCIKPSLQFMHNLYPFCRNSKISRNSSYRFLWNFAQQKTSTQSIGSVKHFQRKCR